MCKKAMDQTDLEGLKTAAEVLMRRLKQKDYKKWLEVIALSPENLMGHTGNELPPLKELGKTIKQLCDSGSIDICMGKDGVVRGRPRNSI